jgi:Putative peptidoglycan binding domain
MAVPFLSPGQTDPAVSRMKKRLVKQLLALGLNSIAQQIAIRSTTYGPAAVEGVRKLQAAKHIHVDGFVGKDTWGALGVHERVTNPTPVMHPGESFVGGEVIVEPGANKPGKPISQITLKYVAKMAEQIGKSIKITTGTNHNKFTVNGNVSDHFTGHAADIGMFANGGTDDSPVGDRIMQACCLLAGDSKQGAKAKAGTGGLFTFTHGGERIQCIWKTNQGGNHHNHVHVGVRPA